MNLNRFKKGYSGTNPERGLRNLPGAVKKDRINHSSSTIHVKGRYISQDTDTLGRFFGMISYIHAWLYGILFPCSIFLGNSYLFSPISIFIISLAIVHGCALFADGLRNSNTPWASKGIKIFWIFTLVTLVSSIVNSILWN